MERNGRRFALAPTTADRHMDHRLEQITQVVSSADEARLRDAIESVRWERRGVLQRLVRIEPSPDGGSTTR
jgi:hypothetical protein